MYECRFYYALQCKKPPIQYFGARMLTKWRLQSTKAGTFNCRYSLCQLLGQMSSIWCLILTYPRVAICNLCFVIFLSLKNTPLAILSASSYETLMPLHKAAGYTTIVASLVHAIVYLNSWAQSDMLHEMLEPNQVAGIMAGIGLFLIGISTFIRRQRYERKPRHPAFIWSYLTHWLFSILRYSRHTISLYSDSRWIAPARL